MSWIWRRWKGDSDPSQQEESHRNIEPIPSTRFDIYPPIVQQVDSNRKRTVEKKSGRRCPASILQAGSEKAKPTNARKRRANEHDGTGRVAKKANVDQDVQPTPPQVHDNGDGGFDIDQIPSPRDLSTEVDETQTALGLRKRQRSESPEAAAESRKRAKIGPGDNSTSPSCYAVGGTNSNKHNETGLAGSVSQLQSETRGPQGGDDGAPGDIEAPYRTATDEIVGGIPVEAESTRTTESLTDAADVPELPGEKASSKKLRWPYISKTWRHENRDGVSEQQNFCPSGRLVGIGTWSGSSHIPGQPEVHGYKSTVPTLPASKISVSQRNAAVLVPASTTKQRLNEDAEILLPPLFEQESPQRRQLCTARERALKPKQMAKGPPQRALEGIWKQSVGSPMGPTEWTG